MVKPGDEGWNGDQFYVAAKKVAPKIPFVFVSSRTKAIPTGAPKFKKPINLDSEAFQSFLTEHF